MVLGVGCCCSELLDVLRLTPCQGMLSSVHIPAKASKEASLAVNKTGRSGVEPYKGCTLMAWMKALHVRIPRWLDKGRSGADTQPEAAGMGLAPRGDGHISV
jgi:hypothetical protein